jgi:DNA-binding IclR family transcriptional regulator
VSHRKTDDGVSVGAVDKAMIVLEAMSRYDRDVPLAVLAEKVGFPKSTLVRLLRSMKRHGIVQQDPRTRRYRLGMALIRLGKAAERQFDLERIVRPFLAELSKSTGETASFAVLEGERAVYLVQVLSDSIIRGVPPIGAELDLHCTAVGKVLLTSFSEEQIESLIREHGLPRHTEKTIIDAESLRKELDRTRQKGYALDDEEAERGGRCIAAPVCDDRDRVIAAVSITGPTTRMRMDQIDNLAAIARRVAEKVTEALREEDVHFE